MYSFTQFCSVQTLVFLFAKFFMFFFAIFCIFLEIFCFWIKFCVFYVKFYVSLQSFAYFKKLYVFLRKIFHFSPKNSLKIFHSSQNLKTQQLSRHNVLPNLQKQEFSSAHPVYIYKKSPQYISLRVHIIFINELPPPPPSCKFTMKRKNRGKLAHALSFSKFSSSKKKKKKSSGTTHTRVFRDVYKDRVAKIVVFSFL